MLDRLMPLLLFWGLRGGLAWFVMHEYALEVTQRLNEVVRALGGM
jgi:hypothetical protein